MHTKAILAIVFVFIGCMSNMVFLELLVKNDAGIGNLVTFLQFLFISIHGFIFVSKCGTKKPRIGLKDYFILVAMFFLVNVCNNMAFGYNIPVPLHMIFRAGSLIANMVMGVIILKKRYTNLKYLSVLMITIGIVISTIVSSQEKSVSCSDCDEKVQAKQVEEHFFWWVIGISLLTFALFLSARMGIYQEWLYSHYGKHPDEALFYTHLLPLPGFLFLYKNIWEHTVLAGQSAPLAALGMPSTWVYLVGNVLTQYMCIRSVYVLTTETSSLTVTLVLTLRKFLSLIFSILYFKNPFTLVHWFGTALVFVGTLIFTEVPQRMLSSKKPDVKVKSS